MLFSISMTKPLHHVTFQTKYIFIIDQDRIVKLFIHNGNTMILLMIEI